MEQSASMAIGLVIAAIRGGVSRAGVPGNDASASLITAVADTLDEQANALVDQVKRQVLAAPRVG